MITKAEAKKGSPLFRLSKLNAFASSIYHSNPENQTKYFMDITNSEVQSFLRSLNSNKVEYMLVGGVATVFHGHVRTTQDLDLWIKENDENKKRLVKALKDENVPAADNYYKVPLIPGWSSIKIGRDGFEADMMGYLKAFSKEDFDNCYKRAVKTEFDGVPITVIHVNDLIKEKKANARHKDLDDIENLEKIQKNKKDKGLSM